MEFQGRALYNFLQIRQQEDPSQAVEPWQLLNYRLTSEEELFRHLPIALSKEAFLLYADSCETPEELLECLWVDEENIEGQEKVYLAIFEMWRRFLPNKQSLSIFCDELDHLIAQFDLGEDIEEKAHTLLDDLENILHTNMQQGLEPKQVFSLISQYTAHDIATFLFDYILELIENHDDVFATSLIEAFEDYVPQKKWFTLLRAYLLSASQVAVWSHLIDRLLEEEEENPSSAFLTELFYFLQGVEDTPLLKKCQELLFPLVSEEEKEELLSLQTI